MNSYVVTGLLAEARDGKRVIVLSENGAGARHVFELLADEAGSEVAIRRRHGEESISFPDSDGRIHFSSVRSGLRGWVADVVFVDCDPTIEQLQVLAPVVASRRGGRVVLR